MKSFEGSFCNLNFSPSTSILLNFFFPFIDIRCFFCQVLQYSRTTVLLKKLKLLKKPLFQKRRWSCNFPPRKTPVAQKHRAISRQEKTAFSTPRRVVLALPFPSRRVCADGRTEGRSRDYYVTTKISRIDRLPNLLSNGAPLADFVRRLRYNVATPKSSDKICRLSVNFERSDAVKATINFDVICDHS